MAEKTVFISYRSDSKAWAFALYQQLMIRGYDVFFNYHIPIGDFPQVILGNIKARAHFIYLLTPTALQSFNEPADWLRLELECAIAEERNIVMLAFEGFTYTSATRYMTGASLTLQPYPILTISAQEFPALLSTLEERLNVEITGQVEPINETAASAARLMHLMTKNAPQITQEALLVEEWLEKGNQARDEKAYETAIEAYSAVLRIQTYYGLAYYLRAYAQQQVGNISAALADYEQVLTLHPTFAEGYFMRGNLHFDEENYRQAIEDYTQAIHFEADLASYMNRGSAYHKLGDFGDALADYHRAVQLNPQHEDAYLKRGILYKDIKNYRAALADFNKVLELNPQSLVAFLGCGDCYDALHDWEGAVGNFNEALRLKPNNAQVYFRCGVIYAEQKYYDKALYHFNKSIEQDPSNIEAYYNRGIVYFSLKRRQEARLEFNSVIRRQADHAGAYYMRGLCYEIEKDFEHAEDDYRQALQLDPYHRKAEIRLAEIRGRLSHPDSFLMRLSRWLSGRH